MRLNRSEYRPVADLTRFPEVMDRAARLKESWEGLIGVPSFRLRALFDYDGSVLAEFTPEVLQVEGQFNGLIGAIRRRVSLPALDGYVVEKGEDGHHVEPHFDRGDYPLYVVHFGDVAPTVVYSGTVLEGEKREVLAIDAIPLPIGSGQVMKFTGQDYHFRKPTDPVKEDEVRQLLVFTARSRGDWIRRLLNWTI